MRWWVSEARVSDFTFQVRARDGKARRGTITTRRGVVETPAFMPVGTQGSVKAVTPDEVRATGAQILLGNTYHLFLRPGEELLGRLGGLHRFMRWDGPILTDSGGFQVYSLSELRKVDDEGVTFRSHIDGSLKRLTPEGAIAMQRAIGSEIMMQLDECPPAQADAKTIEGAMRRTSAWAVRCVAALREGDGVLFPIVQGGVDVGLRLAHVEELAGLGTAGLALGGLAVGEPPEVTQEILQAVAHRMPEERPRYLMGVGYPQDIVGAVVAGMDMFDCVVPTRNARNGQLFTFAGKMNIKNAAFRDDEGPIEEGCDCFTCGNFSRAYLRHLYTTKELLVYRLLTIHNLRFYQRLMERLRGAIEAGVLEAESRSLLAGFEGGSSPAADAIIP